MTGDLSDVLTARLAGDVQGTDNLSMIAAANELDLRDGMACENLADLKLILGVMAGRLQGVLAIAARLTAERDKALAQVAEYEGAICWDTTCLSCAAVLDSMHRETERRERAEEALKAVRALLAEWRDQDPAASLDFGEAVAELDDALNGPEGATT